MDGSEAAAGLSIFHVDQGVTASISGLTLTGAHLGSGGGVRNDGTLTLTSCDVAANAGSPGYPDGITNVGILTLVNSIITGDTVERR